MSRQASVPASHRPVSAGNATKLTGHKLGLLLGNFSSRIGAASITWFVNGAPPASFARKL